MGNVKMRITIDVESGDIETVQRVEIVDDQERISDALYDEFDSSNAKSKSDGRPQLSVTRCHHTTILQTHSSPECIYFHQRGRGWRKVCT
jgi:hypothetical protein